MTRRGERSRWLLGLCLALVGCRSPVLWVGAARPDASVNELSPDAGLGPPAPPTAAGAPAVSEAAVGASQPATASQPSAAGAGLSRAGAGALAPNVDPRVDSDAGSELPVPPTEPPVPTRYPKLAGACPELSGPGTYTFRVGGRSLAVQLYLQPKAARSPGARGPLILYFHALGSSSSEVVTALGQRAIDAVVAQGGVVASFNAVPCLRCGLDDVVWYDEDDAVTDQVVACAREQAFIDPRHIHAVGFSAGALHAMHLLLVRSDFIASVISYSGGMPTTEPPPQDPGNKVPALLSFGKSGLDNAVADFNQASHDWYDRYTPRGYYVLLCNHSGGHVIPADLAPAALRFLMDHPYKGQPEPYRNMLPGELPRYCQNGPGL